MRCGPSGRTPTARSGSTSWPTSATASMRPMRSPRCSRRKLCRSAATSPAAASSWSWAATRCIRTPRSRTTASDCGTRMTGRFPTRTRTRSRAAGLRHPRQSRLVRRAGAVPGPVQPQGAPAPGRLALVSAAQLFRAAADRQVVDLGDRRAAR